MSDSKQLANDNENVEHLKLDDYLKMSKDPAVIKQSYSVHEFDNTKYAVIDGVEPYRGMKIVALDEKYDKAYENILSESMEIKNSVAYEAFKELLSRLGFAALSLYALSLFFDGWYLIIFAAAIMGSQFSSSHKPIRSKYSHVIKNFEKHYVNAEVHDLEAANLILPLPRFNEKTYGGNTRSLRQEGRFPGLNVEDKMDSFWYNKDSEKDIIEFMKSNGTFGELLKLSYEYSEILDWSAKTRETVRNIKNTKFTKPVFEDLEQTLNKVEARMFEIKRIYEGWANDFYMKANEDQNIALMSLISDANSKLDKDKKIQQKIQKDGIISDNIQWKVQSVHKSSGRNKNAREN